MKKIVSVLLATSLVVGAAFAQDADAADKGTFGISGYLRSGVWFDAAESAVSEHTIDDDGAPGAGIELTYTLGDTSFLFGLSRGDGVYLRGTYGSLDTTNYGAAVQFWRTPKKDQSLFTDADGSIFALNTIKAAGFAQFLDKKILIDAKYHQGGGGESDWDIFMGGLWTAPTDILTDNYSGSRGLGAQFKMIPGFNFGFSLAKFNGDYKTAKEYLAKSTVGVKFESDVFTIAGGFTPVDYEFKKAKVYVGAKVPLAEGKLNIYANAEAKNLGLFSSTDWADAEVISDPDISDFDNLNPGERLTGRVNAAAKVTFAPDSRLEAGVVIKELGLYDKLADGKSFEQYIEVYGQYAIIENVLLAKVALKGDLGLGDNKESVDLKKDLNTFSIEPTVFWSLKGDKVTADLDDFIGLAIGYKWSYNYKAKETKENGNLLKVAVRIAF
ncbi:MAG: hypothetical protein Ta2A_13440 [Treponemataceae bacterium]|nr:MAG: hypothetical protein Ta2A_13440 [Treponemataceae bacterium]